MKILSALKQFYGRKPEEVFCISEANEMKILFITAKRAIR